jgi:hypothetical protein
MKNTSVELADMTIDDVCIFYRTFPSLYLQSTDVYFEDIKKEMYDRIEMNTEMMISYDCIGDSVALL